MSAPIRLRQVTDHGDYFAALALDRYDLVYFRPRSALVARGLREHLKDESGGDSAWFEPSDIVPLVNLLHSHAHDEGCTFRGEHRHPFEDADNHTHDDDRLRVAIEEATDAFWAKIAAHYYEITTGDASLASEVAFERAAIESVTTWIALNTPEEVAP